MSDQTKKEASFIITLCSFGFKYGMPEDINMLWDVRFLPNPYWQEELRPKTGIDTEVSDYILGSPEGRNFIKQIKSFIFFIVNQNILSGKKDMKIAIGCTGGRHRSVAITEVMTDILQMLPVQLTVVHRDIEKDEQIQK